MKNYESWAEDIDRWLDQRSGSSKKARDELPSLGTLRNIQRDMVIDASNRLESARKLYTLIRLVEQDSSLAKQSRGTE